MRTGARLLALLALAALFGLPVVSGSSAGAQQAPAGELGCTVFDGSGDTFRLDTGAPHADARADVTQLCVDYGWALRVVVAVASHTAPATDPGWGSSGDSGIELRFDTGGDDQPELAVLADGEDTAVVRHPADGSARCLARFFALPTAYAIEVSRVCLGSDEVRVRALMVYDPAPNPNPGPLIADRAPDAGFVPEAVRVAPAAPPPLEGVGAPSCTPDETNDTVDETFAPVTFDAGDIVESCLQHSNEAIRLTMRMRRPTDPQTDPLWLPDTGVAWDLDVDNDLSEDFVVLFVSSGARVYAADASDAADGCAGTPGFDGNNLIVRLPRACLGNPQFVAERPFSIFARLARVEPEPPAALDLFRFPGFSALVGAPGVTVPTQPSLPTTTTTVTTPTTSPSTTGGTGGGRGSSGQVATGGTTTGARVTSGSTSSTGTRTGALAFTGAVLGLVPAATGAGAVLAGLALLLGSRRRPHGDPPGPWDLLPGKGRRSGSG